MKRNHPFSLTILLAVFLVSGCASMQYGKLRMPEKADAVSVRILQENWENYDIYYAGLHAGHPSAILFDRKNDDRVFKTGRWFKVTGKELLDDLVDSIQRQLPIAIYYPRLWKVLGPDGHHYGYLFTSWDHAVMKAMDEKTLFVNDLPLPPYLAINGDSHDFRTP